VTQFLHRAPGMYLPIAARVDGSHSDFCLLPMELFGSPKAISQRPNHMDRNVPDPGHVQGLWTWLKCWAANRPGRQGVRKGKMRLEP
jgi:hypothetical protein